MIKIAIISIMLSIIVMLIAVSIVTGFRNEIRNKLAGFGAHLQIVSFDTDYTMESDPIAMDFYLKDDILSHPSVKTVDYFATKPGIIRTGEEIQGVILKGVDHHFDWSFFDYYLIRGQIPQIKNDTTELSTQVLISAFLAKQLNIDANDTITAYFINQPGERLPEVKNPQRPPRRFVVSGIYETGLLEMDQKFIIGDIKQVQLLNNWYFDKVSGIEIKVDDFKNLDQVYEYVYENISYDLDVYSIKELNPEIFVWLDYQNVNVYIILFLMTIVSVMAMVSTLLILILEKTSFIGVLKALGMNNGMVRKIFYYQSASIIIRGMVLGNFIGSGLLFLQYYYGIFKLDRDLYYVDTVPVNLQLEYWLYVNIGSLMVCMLAMVIPTSIISNINPLKAIRFD